jgi:hypothetical protein
MSGKRVVTVSFKDEGFEDGEPWGRLFVADMEAIAADPATKTSTSLTGAVIVEMPIGPVGGLEERWVGLSEARRVAEEHGVELSEE